MALKNYNPTSPARRGLVLVDKSQLYKGKPVKALTEGKSRTGGRNNKGHVTSRGIGGGHKQKYRFIDFKRRKWDVPATVERIEYDPNRTAFIALVVYRDGEKRYMVAPTDVNVGDMVVAGPEAEIRPGNALPLRNTPLGTMVYNVELKLGKGGQLARSAGCQAQVMAKEGKHVLLRLPSGELRQVLDRCYATIGQASNAMHSNIHIGKAGRTRWMGRRPKVRGVAMNPIDHPHGGGEGRSKGNHPTTPWGVPTKGKKTRHNKRSNRFIVKRRTK
jgi:large subunit ribosomal protein L2